MSSSASLQVRFTGPRSQLFRGYSDRMVFICEV